jgi:regulatory protein
LTQRSAQSGARRSFVPTEGTITRIALVEHRKDRASVFLDDRYAFAVATDLAACLHRGQHLTEEEVAALLARDDARRAFDRAASYLARRPRSRAEMARYLEERGFGDDAAHSALDRLTELGLLDDRSFAAWWVENRSQHRPRGRYALRSELAARGVPKDDVDAALAGVDEEAVATALALQVAPRHTHLGREEFDQRLGAHLQRRGFEYESIRSALNTAWARRFVAEGGAA